MLPSFKVHSKTGILEPSGRIPAIEGNLIRMSRIRNNGEKKVGFRTSKKMGFWARQKMSLQMIGQKGCHISSDL
eukprot:5102622-Amphidinium_carterae.3